MPNADGDIPNNADSLKLKCVKNIVSSSDYELVDTVSLKTIRPLIGL